MWPTEPHPALARDDYKQRRQVLRHDLTALQRGCHATGHRLVVVFEGLDAAGKGGAIRNLTESLDPRGVHVWPIGPPNTREQGHHYLQRFWEKLPDAGNWCVFDRSWYGRVLVERVDALCPEEDWRRAFGEIRQFEKMLVNDGIVLVKIWLHVSREEQAQRLQKRLTTPQKRWKISLADLRCHRQYPDYVQAIREAVVETGTDDAPWTVIAADCKRHARIQVMQTLVSALSNITQPGSVALSDELRREATALFGNDFAQQMD